MRDLTDRALDLARAKGASYSDIRVVRRQRQSIRVKNGNVESLALSEDQGFGIRVIVDGAWGFASSSVLDRTEVDRITALAVDIGRASASAKKEAVDLGPPISITDQYRTLVQRDPLKVPLDEKVALLLSADEAMRRVHGVSIAEASFDVIVTQQTFASSEGSHIEQEFTETGAGIDATAVGENELQTRSYPNSHGGQWAKQGYEMVEALDLPGNAERIAQEAVELLAAKPCPSGTTTIILDPTQLALQVHESCGHPVELDRVLGTEASFAGTSFMTLDKLDNLRYGSDIVNISADATIPGGLGTFGYDDEGVPAQRTAIIANGLFVNYLTSRETASRLGQTSNGTARADGWNRIPLIRMVNVSLEPGTWSLADMIADTDDGIYMVTNKSWSIDDKRLNFQFGTQIAWEIKKGKLGAMLKNATYTGITPQFWGSCDAIGQREEWRIWGVPNCGKGEPMQVMRVGHGTAPARFRGIRVGVV